MTDVNPEHKTTDMYEAGLLVALRHPLRRIEATGSTKQKIFVFGVNARADADKFYGNAPVGAFEYATALRQVKARLYSG